MNPSVASLICICGIAGLFYLDRTRVARLSKALWLPFVYLCLNGSRPVSAWLGVTPSQGTNVQLEGSPLDATVFALLLVAAVTVLCRRGKLTRSLLTANWPVLIYYAYCFISISWSSYPDVALKRWIKSFDDVAMVLVIFTESMPVAAFPRLISRVGCVLLPSSVLLIKYYGNLGRGYTPDGVPVNTGVTTNKNSLGLIVMVVSLVVLWNVRTLLRDRMAVGRTRRLVAQGALLAFGVSLLQMANSSTASACFCLGSGLILATGLPAIGRRPVRVHTLFLGILLAAVLITLSGGQSMVTSALGRESTFSGRTDIWAAVIPAVSNPIVGEGYETFWIGPDVRKVQQGLAGWWHPEEMNEAHNGYIEVYANLGWIGLCLIALLLISGYNRSVAAFRRSPTIGGLMLAYVAVSAVYSITEAGFRSPGPMWCFLLFSVFGAGGVATGIIGPEEVKLQRMQPKKPS